MSSFQTNRATRMGKRSKTEAFRAQQAVEAQGGEDAPLSKLARKEVTYRVQLKDATIGDSGSKGLLIVGGLHDLPSGAPYNPDGRDTPILGTSGDEGGFPDGTRSDRAVYPEFPIRYSGPGHMTFVDPLKIPTIMGNTVVQGDLTVQGKLIQPPGSAGVLTIPFVLANSAGDLFDAQSQQSVVTEMGINDLVYLNVRLEWTSIGAAKLTPGDVQILGSPVPFFPFVLPVRFSGVNIEVNGSQFFVTNGPSGGSTFYLFENKVTTSQDGNTLPMMRWKESGGFLKFQGMVQLQS